MLPTPKRWRRRSFCSRRDSAPVAAVGDCRHQWVQECGRAALCRVSRTICALCMHCSLRRIRPLSSQEAQLRRCRRCTAQLRRCGSRDGRAWGAAHSWHSCGGAGRGMGGHGARLLLSRPHTCGLPPVLRAPPLPAAVLSTARFSVPRRPVMEWADAGACMRSGSYAVHLGCSAYDQNNQYGQYGADSSSYGYGNYGGALFPRFAPYHTPCRPGCPSAGAAAPHVTRWRRCGRERSRLRRRGTRG